MLPTLQCTPVLHSSMWFFLAVPNWIVKEGAAVPCPGLTFIHPSIFLLLILTSDGSKNLPWKTDCRLTICSEHLQGERDRSECHLNLTTDTVWGRKQKTVIARSMIKYFLYTIFMQLVLTWTEVLQASYRKKCQINSDTINTDFSHFHMPLWTQRAVLIWIWKHQIKNKKTQRSKSIWK